MGVEDGEKTWTLPTLTVEIRMEKVKHLILDAKGKHATCYGERKFQQARKMNCLRHLGWESILSVTEGKKKRRRTA